MSSAQFENVPWEFGHKSRNSREQCYAVVTNSKGESLFDNANADVGTYAVHEESDEDGTTFHCEGEAVDALRLAACAPELLALLKEAVKECGCTLSERDSGHLVECFALTAHEAIAKAEGRS